MMLQRHGLKKLKNKRLAFTSRFSQASTKPCSVIGSGVFGRYENNITNNSFNFNNRFLNVFKY